MCLVPQVGPDPADRASCPTGYNAEYVEETQEIRVSRRLCRTVWLAEETLIHEWAHLRKQGAPHGRRWGSEYGAILAAWHNGGAVEADEIAFRRAKMAPR